MPRIMPVRTAFLVLACAADAAAANFNDFLPGAKAMGMGMAFTAVADDAYALFFNPAGAANTPYLQAGASVGRHASPAGPMTFGALTYLRPFEPMNTATVGAAYYASRQLNGGDKDAFLFHFSRELKLPQLYLSKPLKVGANFKFINVDQGPGGPNVLGVGFDAGVLARGSGGLSAGLALLDLTTKVGVPRPALSLGLAYAWQKRLTVSADLRQRGRQTEVYPGLEASFHQGLLKARAGRGFGLDGVGQMSLGLGVNFSPLVVDVAMTLPVAGIHRQGGAYQASVSWRFGAPSFAGNFVGQAAAQAEQLKAEIERLQERQRTMEAAVQAAETNREISEGEVTVLRQRLREMSDEYRLLQRKRDQADFDAREAEIRRPKPAPTAAPVKASRPAPRPAPRWPRMHEVKPGDTLRSLAKAYYGDPTQWELIYEANARKIERGLPRVGEVLLIPEPKR